MDEYKNQNPSFLCKMNIVAASTTLYFCYNPNQQIFSFANERIRYTTQDNYIVQKIIM